MTAANEPTITMAAREYVDMQINLLKEAVEQRWGSDQAALIVQTAYLERRLADLNGEAGRLKTVLDASVPQQVFHAYVTTQRDKDDAREKVQRDAFAAYADSQAVAFKKYSEDVGAKLSAINTRIAGFVGGGTVLLAAIQFWLNYAK